jgi:hypothetical protein
VRALLKQNRLLVDYSTYTVIYVIDELLSTRDSSPSPVCQLMFKVTDVESLYRKSQHIGHGIERPNTPTASYQLDMTIQPSAKISQFYRVWALATLCIGSSTSSTPLPRQFCLGSSCEAGFQTLLLTVITSLACHG